MTKFRIDGIEYIIQKRLGKGGLGIVNKIYCPSTEKTYAHKKQIDSTNPIVTKMYEKEAEILKRITKSKIPRTPKLKGLVKHKDNTHSIFMEYIEGINCYGLHSDLNIRKQLFPTTLAKLILYSISETLTKLSELNPIITHNDIKPEQILISTKGEPYLLDFGSCAITPQTFFCSPTYVDPHLIKISELYQKQFETEDFLYNDVFGLSITGYELLTGINPFNHIKGSGMEIMLERRNPNQKLKLENLIKPHQIFNDIDPQTSNLIHLGLNPDPKKRPKMYQIYNFLKEILQNEGLFDTRKHAIEEYIQILYPKPNQTTLTTNIHPQPKQISFGSPLLLWINHHRNCLKENILPTYTEHHLERTLEESMQLKILREFIIEYLDSVLPKKSVDYNKIHTLHTIELVRIAKQNYGGDLFNLYSEHFSPYKTQLFNP